jgi:hypothetical protein
VELRGVRPPPPPPSTTPTFVVLSAGISLCPMPATRMSVLVSRNRGASHASPPPQSWADVRGYGASGLGALGPSMVGGHRPLPRGAARPLGAGGGGGGGGATQIRNPRTAVRRLPPLEGHPPTPNTPPTTTDTTSAGGGTALLLPGLAARGLF